MKKLLAVVAVLVAVACVGYAQDYKGKTDVKKLGDDLVAGKVPVGETLLITTNAYTLTPTAEIMLLTASTVTTSTLANVSIAGQKLTLVNVGTTNIVVADSANVQSTGAITLGAWDSASFVGEMSATNWVQISTSNN